MIDAGRRSKWRSIERLDLARRGSCPVPNDSTESEIGRAMPMP